jgi:UDP-glucose 4-epimerase
MTKVLITGANSFIGINIRKFSHFRDVEEMSLIDRFIEEINFSEYDIVIHLAAIVHRSKNIPEKEYFSVNRDLPIRVANQAKSAGVKQFIFLSTSKVYGKFINSSDPWNEDSECFPDDAYGKSKYEAEINLRKLDDNNFTVSIVRTPVVYGYGNKANMLKLMKLVKILPVLPFNNIQNKRNYTYVENIVAFIDRIIELRVSGTFIAMDDTALSTTDLVKYLSKYLGKKTILFSLPKFIISLGTVIMPGFFDRLYGSSVLDNSVTKKILAFKPPFSTEEGIKKMIDINKYPE